jgi:hypothetical protein
MEGWSSWPLRLGVTKNGHLCCYVFEEHGQLAPNHFKLVDDTGVVPHVVVCFLSGFGCLGLYEIVTTYMYTMMRIEKRSKKNTASACTAINRNWQVPVAEGTHPS